MHSKLIYTVAFVIISFSIYAQWRNYNFDIKGPQDGLTTNINAITQDSSGLIYLGTGQGLIRYDGNEFKQFFHDPNDSTSVQPGEVWDLITGNQGNLWLGLRFHGLNKYSPKTDRFTHFPFPSKSLSGTSTVASLFDDHNGSIWVGGSEFTLFKFDKLTEKFTVFQPEFKDSLEKGGRYFISNIIADPTNKDLLWFSVIDYKTIPENYYGLFTFNKLTGQFKRENCGGAIIYQFADGRKILGKGETGIRFYHPSDSSCIHKNIYSRAEDKSYHPLVRCLLEDGNKWWMGASNALITMNKDYSYKTISEDEDQGVVTSIYKDNFGHIWIGRSAALNIFDKRRQHINYYPLQDHGVNMRIYPGVLAYDEVSNSLCLANNSNTLFRVNLDDDSPPVQIDLANPTVGITSLGSNKLLYSLTNGLYELDFENPKRNKKILSDIPKSFKLENHKRFIVGCSRQLFYWMNKDYSQVKKLPLHEFKDSEISFIGFNFISDSKAIVFNEKLYEIDLETGSIISLKYPVQLNPNEVEIRSAVVDDKGHYWMILPNSIGRFERKEDSLILIKNYNAVDGLENNWAQRLFVDYKGRVWVFSGNGLNCIDPSKEEIRYFGVKDGLPVFYNDPYQLIETKNDEIAAASGTGIILFHPDSLWDSKSEDIIPIFIKAIRIDGQMVKNELGPNYVSSITLAPHQKSIDFEFQGLSYQEDPRINYTYRIKEVGENWISIGSNKFITLPNLSPGDYSFEIKAGNSDDPRAIKKIDIQVEAPFYRRWWFVILSLSVLTLLIFAILRSRIKEIKKQEEINRLRAKREAELELKALRSQMNPHFMFNSLNSIKNYILQAKPKIAAEYLSNFAHLIRMILQNSREKSISLQEELDTLLLYIDLEKLRFENEFDFHYHVDDKINLESVQIPPMILQPYIENAIWHGLMHKETKGNLSLIFQLAEDHKVQCIIDDDGVGRKASQNTSNSFTKKYKSMGMGITKDRIDIINKMDSLGITIEILDKYDTQGNAEGTRVILTIPVE